MSDDERRRPHDHDAERMVLGAMMLNPDAAAAALSILTAEDFDRPAHTTVFVAIADQFDTGEPTDPVAVANNLRRNNHLDRVGGHNYLHTLIADVPTTANVGYWADLVAEQAGRARLLDASTRIGQLVTAGADDLTDLQDRARELIDAAAGIRSDDPDDGVWLDEVVDDHIKAWDQPQVEGVPSPFRDLNDVLNDRGLLPGQVAVVAARPGIGKSVMATTWALSAAAAGHGVLLVSLEMDRGSILNRLIAAHASVRLADINSHTLTEVDRYRVGNAADELRRAPIRIEDRFHMPMGRLRALARDVARSHRGLGLLVLDYIQLLAPADPRQARREQVDGFSRGLKALAKELGVPVIALAQLNREVESRVDKVPKLSDLRESGSLEQDADIVMMLHRPDAAEHDNPRAGELDIHLVKHRNGPTAVITVAHQLHYARFRDIARG